MTVVHRLVSVLCYLGLPFFSPSLSLSVRACVPVCLVLCQFLTCALRPSAHAFDLFARSFCFVLLSISNKQKKTQTHVRRRFFFFCSLFERVLPPAASLDAYFCTAVLRATLLVFEALLSLARTRLPPPSVTIVRLQHRHFLLSVELFVFSSCLLSTTVFYAFLCSVCVSVVFDAAAIPLAFLSLPHPRFSLPPCLSSGKVTEHVFRCDCLALRTGRCLANKGGQRNLNLKIEVEKCTLEGATL